MVFEDDHAHPNIIPNVTIELKILVTRIEEFGLDPLKFLATSQP